MFNLFEMSEKPKLKLVVRVRTSKYLSGDKMVWKKELYPLKSKSELRSSDMFIDPIEDMDIILNINGVEDGMYYVETVNTRRDWRKCYAKE